MCTLGHSAGWAGPMQFKFKDDDDIPGGRMTFTGPVTSRLLLVADVGRDAVHVIDVAGQSHVGYVAAPGRIAGPRGVAARGSAAAVSTWKQHSNGAHAVHVFEGSRGSWTRVRGVGDGIGHPSTTDGHLNRPLGLRFTGDGTGLVVADTWNHRVSLFSSVDGSFQGHVATGLSSPYDIEEHAGGWLVTQTEHVVFVTGEDGADRALLHPCGSNVRALILALADVMVVPGMGMVLRDMAAGRIFVFWTPDLAAMDAMSAARMTWMAAVARVTRFKLASCRRCG